MGIEIAQRKVLPAGSFIPEDYGYKAWTFDPALGTANQLLVTQQVMAMRIPIRETMTISNIVTYVNTAGASLTYARVALFDESRNQLALSSDLISSFQGTGFVTAAITPVTVSGGTGRFCYAALLTTGASTQPTFYRLVAGSGLYSGQINTPFGTEPRGGTMNGQASMPATLTLTAGAGIAWVALS